MLHFPKWKIAFIAAVCVLGIVFALPNLFTRDDQASPGWFSGRQVNLGLDLQGGSHLLLEVDFQALLRERLQGLVDETRIALRKERIGYSNLGIRAGGVSFRLVNPANVEIARELVEALDPDLAVDASGEGEFTLSFTESAIAVRRRLAVDQSIEIVRRRIDETGVREPTIQRQGEDRILVQLPGIDDPDRIKALLGKTAKMTFHLIDETTLVANALAGRVPPGSVLLMSDQETDASGEPIPYVVRKRVVVGGDTLVSAQSSFQDNQPVVSFRFDSIGTRKFGEVTRENVGQRLAIVLDGKVISAPVIREPILGGSGVISGRFTVQETIDLALLLRAGALPAPLTILEERTVGPDLGADSIRAGGIAAAIGLFAVIFFMALYYGLFGIFSAVSLVLNLVIILGLLSLLQATLTLPGIAGIVLTLGMAVDANVLIFERIREEARGGKTPVAAMDAGYRRALTTIIDANVTTLIAAGMLFYFGSGPVKGFAVTLGIGIMTSMFTAMMVTRLLSVVWLRRRRPKALPL
ncbi:MAG: protein translocase subunit SecD [Alphaproteobacteria bacterium]